MCQKLKRCFTNSALRGGLHRTSFPISSIPSACSQWEQGLAWDCSQVEHRSGRLSWVQCAAGEGRVMPSRHRLADTSQLPKGRSYPCAHFTGEGTEARRLKHHTLSHQSPGHRARIWRLAVWFQSPHPAHDRWATWLKSPSGCISRAPRVSLCLWHFLLWTCPLFQPVIFHSCFIC